MFLEKLSERVPAGLTEVLRELGDGDGGFGGTPFGRGEATLEEFLLACRDGEDPAKVSPSFVPQSMFWMIEDADRVVGIVRMRHHLNDHLLQSGGHVGYYVAPSERGKGYATQALRDTIRILKKMGVDRVLVTVNPVNLASIRVALANGGVLDGQGYSPVTKNVVNRYWIDTSRL